MRGILTSRVRGNERQFLVGASVVGTICLFGLLIFFSFRNGSHRPGVGTPVTTCATPTGRANGVVASDAGTAGPLSRRQLIDRGHDYGRNGDWQNALECFRQVLASGHSTEYEWSYATASALGVGDMAASEQLCVQMMEVYGKSNDAGTAERCAKQCLALPKCSEELLEQAAERAGFAIRKDQNNPWRQLAKGLAEYRRQNWSGALDWLRQPETSGLLEVSIQAWCVGAMARRQMGDAAGARHALEEVDKRKKVLVWTGELGRLQDKTWDSIARAMALRAEAEQLILGKIVSPPLNPSEVLENRQKWQPVAWSLNAADQMGKQSQWAPAVEYYSQAMQESAFDWTVSEMKQDLVPQKMAAAFLMAGEQTRYCDLVRVLVERKMENLAPVMQEHYAQIFVMNPELLPVELKGRALAYARRVCEFPDSESNPWLGLLRGTTEYREGRFEKALEALSQVFFPPAESDGASRVMAYKAMTCKKLGRTQETLEASQEANALFARHLTRPGDWTNSAFYQLAMKELLALLASK